jgi:hypothetical protein
LRWLGVFLFGSGVTDAPAVLNMRSDAADRFVRVATGQSPQGTARL